MNPIFRFAAAAALLCGFAFQSPAGDSSGEAASAEPQTIGTPERVVIARVGGDDEITVEEFIRYISRDGELVMAARDPKKKVGIVKEMITQRLLARAAIDQGLVESKEGKAPTREELIRGQQKLKARHFPLPPPPPEKELREYYEQNKERLGIPRSVRITQIQFRYPEGATEEQKAVARVKAERAWKQLEAGVELEIVASLTENPRARDAKGDLGFLPLGANPWLDQALASTGKGQHTGLLESPVGYEILAVTDAREPVIVPFEKVQGPVVQKLREAGQMRARNLYVHQLAKKYGVEIMLEGYEGALP